MRNLLLIFFLLLIFAKSDAQRRFSKYYHNDVALRTSNQAKDFYEIPDSGFIFTTISSDLYTVDTLGFAKTYLQMVRTNSVGDTLWTKLYSKRNFNIRVRYIVKMYDGNFLLAGNEFDLVKYHNDTIGSKILLVKITSNGDTLWTKTLDIGDGDEFANKLINTNDNGFAIVGQVCNKKETNCDMYLMKLDSNANFQWYKIFTWGTNYWENPTSVLQSKYGDYYLTSATREKSSDIQSGYLVKTDVLGNLKWQKKSDNEGAEGTYLTNISSGNSNTLLLCGLMGFGSYTKGWLLRIDTSGEYILNKKIGENNKYTSLTFVQEFHNNIFVQGETNNYYSIKEFNRTCLYKYTSIGEVVWKRAYQDSLNERGVYITYQTKQTSDGGFAMIGFGDNPKDTLKNQDVWLLKVDSMGCLYNNCLSMGIEDDVHIEPVIKVYPNPSNGFINIETNISIVKVELIDALGRRVYEDSNYIKQPISILEFPPGIYFLRMGTKEGKFYTEKVLVE